VIKTAIDVIRAQLVAMREAILGLLIDFLKDTIVEPDPMKNQKKLKTFSFYKT